MRAFIGLSLPEDVCDVLEDMQAGLHFGRLVPREDFHLTLAFLDDQPEETLAEIHEDLDAGTWPALSLSVTGLGLFGGEKPRALFAEVASDPTLTQMRDRIRRLVRRHGVTLSHERFRPHVTLARFNPRKAQFRMGEVHAHLSDIGAVQIDAVQPEALVLYHSLLGAEGATYEPLAEYPLGALAAPDGES